MTAVNDMTVTPSACQLTYTHSLSEASSVVSLFDPALKKFEFFEASDLTQTLTVSPFYKDITVSLIGSAGVVTATTAQKTFTLRVKNPCVDSAYNSIGVPTDFSNDYTIN